MGSSSFSMPPSDFSRRDFVARGGVRYGVVGLEPSAAPVRRVAGDEASAHEDKLAADLRGCKSRCDDQRVAYAICACLLALPASRGDARERSPASAEA